VKTSCPSTLLPHQKVKGEVPPYLQQCHISNQNFHQTFLLAPLCLVSYFFWMLLLLLLMMISTSKKLQVLPHLFLRWMGHAKSLMSALSLYLKIIYSFRMGSMGLDSMSVLLFGVSMLTQCTPSSFCIPLI